MNIGIDPLLPPTVLLILAALAVLGVGLALWRGLAGWALRALGAVALLLALLAPAIVDEEHEALADLVILLVDESASQSLGTRAQQTEEAVRHIRAQIARLPGTELRIRRITDDADDRGTLAMTAMAEALAAEPSSRIAGVLLVSDGIAHDAALAPASPAPVHLVLSGARRDHDRRLVIESAPAFAIIDEEVTIRLRIEDQGTTPSAPGAMTELIVTPDDGPARSHHVPVGEEIDLPVTLSHGGMNTIQLAIPALPGELTVRNNIAIARINGIRDRLRVLLISGEPHAGERVWRNLLKSDASVDLVHFTILRPPDKQDNVPVDEMSLIAFPTHELFVDRIDDFDLIILDRYRMRGILPMAYIANIVDYVRDGGTLLISAGPEFGAVDSLFRTPLAPILPVAPTARVLEGAFVPRVTELGRRHPVTAGLEDHAPRPGGDDGTPGWGRWLRAVGVTPLSGQVVMEGPEEAPLLVLDRVDEGRVAVLASDQAWLWARGFDGGGPQLELLRRLAHWMLKEPGLEEEALDVEIAANRVTVTRQTLQEAPPGPLHVTGPDGDERTLDMAPLAPGRYHATWEAADEGLYRLAQDDLARVIGIGPAVPREYEETIANATRVPGAVRAPGTSVSRIEDGLPAIRPVAAGGVVAGRGWIGITPRHARLTTRIGERPLLPPWAWLLIAASCAVGAWLIEGRRGTARG